MEISLDKREDSYGLITLKLAEADYKPELDTQLKEYRRKANLKGFRPGKVPLGLIKKMVGTDMKAEVISRSTIDHLNKYIEDEKLELIFQPFPKEEPLTINDFENNDDFEFSFEVCLEPTVDYSLSEDFSISGYKISPSDAEVEDAIEKMKADMPQIIQADTVEDGDFVKGTFKQVEGDFEKETVLPLNQVAEDKRDLFIGKGKEDAFTFDLRAALPDDKEVKLLFGTEEEETAALTGEFELTITEITRNAEAEINQEFMDRVLGPDLASNEEEFRTELKKKMAEVNQDVADTVLANDIRERLVKEVEVSLPEDLLKKVLKQSQKEPITDEEVETRFPNFLDSVKWRAISGRIFKDADLNIENEEIEAAARDVARQQLQQMGLVGMPEEQMESFVNMMMEREESRKQNMDQAYDQVFNSKLNAYIKTKITIAEDSIGIDKFKEIIEEMNKKAEAEAAALAPETPAAEVEEVEEASEKVEE